MTGDEVRIRFLEYFKKHGHQIVRSSSLVPQDDPTLLFTNAGMVQFKRMFLGEESRGYVRATSSQKCVRAGGKHNDLENVGYTARHHTFFEMLGNFSFGDYFKEKAIEFGWDLLTNGYGFPADKLWVSIYLDDDEAAEIWNRRMGVPAERIARFGEKDNFWAMGDTGPCGPCSEIHLDRGEGFGCGKPDCAIGCDCDRFLELWNLVFMQFNRDATGKMTPLPKPSIDTGAGLERLASALQNVPTNFDSDLLKPIMEKVFELSGKSMEKSREVEVASKVIADHSRAAAFLIGDGILPSNEGRGYVLRRIMRRAIRYGRNIGLKKPFLHETARVVFEIMKTSYPDLKEASAFITSVIKNEEMRFADTLDHGLRLLTDTLQELREKGRTVIPGEFIFKLYDTYGFPVDIVRDVVREENFSLDMDGFESCMDDQREKSKAVAAFSELGEAYKKLSSRGYKPKFIGYEHLSCEAEVVLLVKDGREVEAATEGSFIEIVTDKTPFYGESGGQVGDKGSMYADGLKVVVHDTIKDPTGLIIHQGEIAQGSIRKGQKLTLTVSGENRGSTALNHTATHILHSVLRKVLGDHVKQAGSLVAPDRLRFDFTHFAQVEPEVLDSIERMVNEQIQRNVAVDTEEMIAERAFKSGATALFEEKYGDRVRVVSLADFSKELCGGTHTSRTGNIGLFRIISESSVASGIRRIEAMTGPEAVAFTQQQNRVLRETARMLKEKPDTLLHRVEKMLKHQKMLEKELDQMKSKLAVRSVEDTDEGIRSINGVKVIARRVEVDDPSALRELADRFKEKIQSGIVVLGAESGSKALLVTAVTRDLTKRFHAGKIVSALAKELGGGGGGRPDMAQAGGNEPEKLDAVLEKVFQLIEG